VCVDVFTSNGTQRTSSLSAFLSQVPDNLTIWTDAVAAQLLFAGTKVIGVEILDGRKGDDAV
jgi:choline dehydrogenase-like flavoprotein